MRIAFLGLGLIGGSVAKAIRGANDGPWRGAELAAWTPEGDGPRRALAAGAIDEASASIAACVRGADLVVLAAPPLETLELIEWLASFDLGSAVVTDVASTKAAIVARADDHHLRFVGGHPMAGRETTGFGAATSDLFADRPWVVVAGARSTSVDVALVESLARACGARAVRMEAAEHDAAVAAVSHLPLVASAALAAAVVGEESAAGDAWTRAAPLAASGWRDMTRLARGDVDMAAGIAATNHVELARQVRAYRDALEGWLDLLEDREGPDPDRLAARFRDARERADRAAQARG
jgi:prephenate dehydrogenase